MFSTLDISTSALVAQRTNLDVIAGNIAMKDVTRDVAGNPGPYRRRVALFAPGDPSRGGNRAFCDALVPNPFFDLPEFAGTSLGLSSTISRLRATRPFPQFDGDRHGRFSLV